MKEMLQARKEELQKRGVKGFTLMEMLIVVAIIAVLVAIAIPIFTAQLDKARAQTDAANIRAGYATVMAAIVTDPTNAKTSYTLAADGTTDGTSGAAAYKCVGKASDLNAGETIGGQDATAIGWVKDSGITYTWNAASNKLTIAKS